MFETIQVKPRPTNQPTAAETKPYRKPIKISHSQSKVWQSCQKYWEFRYFHKWRPKKQAQYLAAGTMCHETLAVYYTYIAQGATVLEARQIALNYLIETHFDLSNVENVDMEFMARLSKIMNRYMQQAHVMDEGMKILATEYEAMLPLETEKGREILIHFIVDLIYMRDGYLGIMDHKTMNGARWWTSNQVLMDSQLGTYSAAISEMGFELPSGRIVRNVDELTVNQINTFNYSEFDKITNDKLFRRVDTHRTATEMRYMLNHFLNLVDEIQDKIEKGGPFIRTLTRNCVRCPFFEPCLFEMKGADVREILELGFVRDTNEEDPKSAEARGTEDSFDTN